MCDKCDLVDRALHGGLPELSETLGKEIKLVHNGGFFIIITNPTSPGFMCLDRTHGRGHLNLLLLVHREAMADACEGLFPDHYLDYRPKSAMEHFCFFLRPKKGKAKKREPLSVQDPKLTEEILKVRHEEFALKE